MDRNELALEMGGELGDLDAVFLEHAAQVVAIGFAFGGFVQIEEAAVPCGNLDAFIAEAGGPFGD